MSEKEAYRRKIRILARRVNKENQERFLFKKGNRMNEREKI